MNPNNPTSPQSDAGAAAGGADAGRSFDRAVNATHEAVDRAAASLDHATQRLREGYEHARAVEQAWADDCRGRVREHPLAAIAVALAVGVVIGALSSRSHR